jgi:ubiquitin C-terminal hydrolase
MTPIAASQTRASHSEPLLSEGPKESLPESRTWSVLKNLASIPNGVYRFVHFLSSKLFPSALTPKPTQDSKPLPGRIEAIGQGLQAICHRIIQLANRLRHLVTGYELDPKGIGNLGNTCFMNAALQLLGSMGNIETALRYTLTQEKGEDPASFQQRQQLQESVRGLISELKKENPNREVINTAAKAITDSPKIRGQFPDITRYQGDSFEFFQTISNLLQINNQSQYSIQVGNYRNDPPEPIGGDPQSSNLIPLLKPNFGADAKITMQQLIKENLATPDELTCADVDNRCQQTRYTHNDIKQLVSISFVLPRFVDTPHPSGPYMQQKGKGQITSIFQKKLELPINEELVELEASAVVCHRGSGITSGHYVTIVRDSEGFKEISDAYSRRLSDEEAEDIVSRNGYMVNYNRVVSKTVAD